MTNYNVTFLNSTNTIMDYLNGVNTMTDGLFSIFFLIGVFIIIFIMYAGYDIKDVLLTDTFICTILAVLLWGVGWVGYGVPAICVVGLFGSIMVKIFTKHGS